jgi:hypothetical protein
MQLPTAREINPVPTDLDGKCAERHFLGKTLQQAEALFREASILYQEDLMFMGPIAFRFYVQAAISYIQSDAATDVLAQEKKILRHYSRPGNVGLIVAVNWRHAFVMQLLFNAPAGPYRSESVRKRMSPGCSRRS